MISLIAAMANHRVIGSRGKMPWHLPADLVWFKKQTLHKPIIMGRNTFNSIGKVLPERLNIVISRSVSKKPSTKHLHWVSSLDGALQLVKDEPEIMIIGGGEIYRQFFPMADKLYLTHIDLDTLGDTLFPDYQQEKWQIIKSEHHTADDKNPYAYRFEILTRK